MNTTELARRAAEEGLLDVAYATVDAPFGRMLVAVTPQGLVRTAFETERADDVLDELADRISPRVLEAPARLDGVRRELDEYFDGRRTELRDADRLAALERLPAARPRGVPGHPLRRGAHLLRAGGRRRQPATRCAPPGTPWPETRSRSSCPATACCARAAAWAATAAGSSASAGCSTSSRAPCGSEPGQSSMARPSWAIPNPSGSPASSSAWVPVRWPMWVKSTRPGPQLAARR